MQTSTSRQPTHYSPPRQQPKNTMNTKSVSILFRSFVGVILLLTALGPSALRGAVLQGGVARVNITPPPEMKAILGGYGERMSKPAVGVHDSGSAKALR